MAPLPAPRPRPRKLEAWVRGLLLPALAFVLLARPSEAAFLADTDGDGTSDEIEVCDTTRVCVVHEDGTTTTYSDPDWRLLDIAWIADTDGKPGAEIVLIVRGSDRLHGVCVIHDATQTIASYLDPAWETVNVNWVVDMDGDAIADILLSYQSGPDHGFSVIHDAGQEVRHYPYPGRPAVIQQLGDFDGEGGAEFCALLESPAAYEVITDRTGERATRYDCTLEADRRVHP